MRSGGRLHGCEGLAVFNLQSGADGASAAIFKLHLGFDELLGATGVQRIHQHAVFVGNKAAAYLVGAGQLAVVAEDALEEDTFTGLSADLQRYTEVYGGSVVVVNANREVYALIKDCVEKVNADLATDAMLAGSQVTRFLVLHKELDADDGELTRTNKVRRGFIADKYCVLVDALYAGRSEQFIETQVKFEDGRTGSVSATLKIEDSKTFTPVKSAA